MTYDFAIHVFGDLDWRTAFRSVLRMVILKKSHFSFVKHSQGVCMYTFSSSCRIGKLLQGPWTVKRSHPVAVIHSSV
jgi:hypothetical protein